MGRSPRWSGAPDWTLDYGAPTNGPLTPRKCPPSISEGASGQGSCVEPAFLRRAIIEVPIPTRRGAKETSDHPRYCHLRDDRERDVPVKHMTLAAQRRRTQRAGEAELSKRYNARCAAKRYT